MARRLASASWLAFVLMLVWGAAALPAGFREAGYASISAGTDSSEGRGWVDVGVAGESVVPQAAEPGRSPDPESEGSGQAGNWIDLAIILVLAGAAIWGYVVGVFRLGALLIIVAGCAAALRLFAGPIAGFLGGFFEGTDIDMVVEVAVYAAIFGAPLILYLAWKLVSRIRTGNRVSRMLGAVLGASIAFLLLSLLLALWTHSYADFIRQLYPEVDAMIGGSRLAPVLTDAFDTLVRGVLVHEEWGRQPPGP